MYKADLANEEEITKMVENMLEGIEVMLSVDYFDIKDEIEADKAVLQKKWNYKLQT